MTSFIKLSSGVGCRIECTTLLVTLKVTLVFVCVCVSVCVGVGGSANNDTPSKLPPTTKARKNSRSPGIKLGCQNLCHAIAGKSVKTPYILDISIEQQSTRPKGPNSQRRFSLNHGLNPHLRKPWFKNLPCTRLILDIWLFHAYFVLIF